MNIPNHAERALGDSIKFHLVDKTMDSKIPQSYRREYQRELGVVVIHNTVTSYQPVLCEQVTDSFSDRQEILTEMPYVLHNLHLT